MMLQDIMTVFWRDWVVLRRQLKRFILSRMVTPILYLVAFGWGIGRNVQVSSGNYLDYIVPGILALNSMNISFNSVASPLNMSRQYHKTLEEYLVAPISSMSFVIGKVLSGTFRGLISSLIIILLSYAFGAQFELGPVFCLVLILNCMVFSSLGFVAAMLINSHEDMASFSTYVLLPMSFLCATFFNVDKLPIAVRWIIEALPLTHTSQALRALSSGNAVDMLSWVVLLSYVVLLLAGSFWTMKKVRQ